MVTLHDAIQNGVGNGGVADPGMLVLHRQLASDDGGLVASPVVDDPKQIRARHAVDGPHGPVVEDQHVGLGQLKQPFAEGATAVPDAQFFLQAG